MAPGKSGPHEMAGGSSSLLSSHGRVIGPQDGLKKDSSNIFVRVTPIQKKKIIEVLQKNGHTHAEGINRSVIQMAHKLIIRRRQR